MAIQPHHKATKSTKFHEDVWRRRQRDLIGAARQQEACFANLGVLRDFV
jgi:hypothetical protein